MGNGRRWSRDLIPVCWDWRGHHTDGLRWAATLSTVRVPMTEPTAPRGRPSP